MAQKRRSEKDKPGTELQCYEVERTYNFERAAQVELAMKKAKSPQYKTRYTI